MNRITNPFSDAGSFLSIGKILAPWIALVAGALLSVFVFTVIRDDIERAARLRFDCNGRVAKHAMESRIHSYADILYGARSTFFASCMRRNLVVNKRT